MKYMHISQLPLLFSCPSSALPTDHPYDPGSEAADLGHAVHEGLADVVMSRDPDLDAIAQRYGVPRGDVNALVGAGRVAWGEVSSAFHNVRAEMHLEARGKLRGRTDVLGLSEERIAVLDWKTSRERSDVRPQLRGYAACAADMFGMPMTGHIDVYTVWLRLMEIDHMSVTDGDLTAFWEQYGYAERSVGNQYGPGEACTYCRRQLVCDARTELVQSSVRAFGPMASDDPGVMSPALLAGLYPRARMLQRALDQYREALRMQLRSGPMPDGNGNTLELGEVKRTKVDARRAWPILVREGFDDDDIAACISMSTSALMDVAAAKAVRGQKGKAKAALREMLEAAGAVNETVHPTIKVRKGDHNE